VPQCASRQSPDSRTRTHSKERAELARISRSGEGSGEKYLDPATEAGQDPEIIVRTFRIFLGLLHVPIERLQIKLQLAEILGRDQELGDK